MIKIILLVSFALLGCTSTRDKDELEPSDMIYGQLEVDDERYQWNSGPMAGMDSPIPIPRQSPLADETPVQQKWAAPETASHGRLKLSKASMRKGKSKKRNLYR